MEPVKINNYRDKRQIKQIYSKEKNAMVTIPKEIRTDVEAYKNFKRPAFYSSAKKG